MKFTKIAAFAAVAVMACGVFYGCGETTTSTPTTSSQAGNQGGQTQAATLTGTWKFAGIKGSDGKVQSLEEYALAQAQAQDPSIDANSDEVKQAMEMLKPVFDALDAMRMEMKEGGAVTQTTELNGQKGSAEGTYTVDGDQVTFNFEGQQALVYTFDAQAGTLSIEQQGMTIVMEKA